MEDMPYVKLRSLDKITARTVTFEARVGSTVKFGPLYIKTQACRKAPPIAQPESASFLQIWEMVPAPETAADKQQEPVPQWVFSGWMFASSPAISSMDHTIYDVWVLDCLEDTDNEAETVDDAAEGAEEKSEGQSGEDAAQSDDERTDNQAEEPEKANAPEQTEALSN
jgi:hypothetical protein